MHFLSGSDCPINTYINTEYGTEVWKEFYEDIQRFILVYAVVFNYQA
jgi:hypothetical protein